MPDLTVAENMRARRRRAASASRGVDRRAWAREQLAAWRASDVDPSARVADLTRRPARSSSRSPRRWRSNRRC